MKAMKHWNIDDRRNDQWQVLLMTLKWQIMLLIIDDSINIVK